VGRAHLAVRDTLVRTRTGYVAIIKAFVRRERLRIPSGDAEHTVAKLQALALPSHAEIAATDARLLALAKNPSVTRLQSMSSIGPVTALAFVASLDDVTRFHSAKRGLDTARRFRRSLRANHIECERSEPPKIARLLQRTLGNRV